MNDSQKRHVLVKALFREGVQDDDSYIGNVVLEAIEQASPETIEVFKKMDALRREVMVREITENARCAIVCTVNTRDTARIAQPAYLHPELSFRERIENAIDEYFDEP